MPPTADPEKLVADAVVHGPINKPNQLTDTAAIGAMKNPVKPLHNNIAVWLSSPTITRATAVTTIPMDASKDRMPGDNHLLMMVLNTLEPVIQHQYKKGTSAASFVDTTKYFAT